MKSYVRLSILCLAVAGCASKHAGPTTAASTADATVRQVKSSAYASQVSRGSVSKGRRVEVQMRTKLDVYVLSLPLGTVSRNEEFWKRVNEQALDVATYDLLFKNGVRVGEAPL